MYREVLRAVRGLELPEVAERDVLLALEAALPGPLALVWAAGREAGLAPEVLRARSVGLFLAFAAGNLADDLCDGDCTQWEQPERHAPYVQFLLQNLAWSELAAGGLSNRALQRMGTELARGAGPQALEVRTGTWTAPLYRQVAEGIAGRQWAAYLTALLDGTDLEARAAAVGLSLGVVAYTVEDVRSGDARFFSLSPAEKDEVIGWAQGHAASLEGVGVAWLERTLAPLRSALAAPHDGPIAPEAVAAYYEEKTEGILRRYGPGPRVHFHTGLVGTTPGPEASPEALGSCVRTSQDALLQAMAAQLRERGHAPGRLLDVGCGLGGGSLFWAGEHDAHVTAITNVPGHVGWVERFAREAGVEARVKVRCVDALEVEGEACFDTVVACESSCYLPRGPWLQAVARLLRPGGRVIIADAFLGREDQRIPFDRYWRTRLGTHAEYLQALQAAGLELEVDADLSAHAARFWDVTLRLLEGERREAVGAARERLKDSRREHRRHRDGLRDGGLSYGILVARRP